MANAYKNTAKVTKFAVANFINALNITMKVDRQLDTKNLFDGDSGGTVLIRRTVEFVVSDGTTLVEQDIEEGTVSVSLSSRKHVAFAVTSYAKTLNICWMILEARYLCRA